VRGTPLAGFFVIESNVFLWVAIYGWESDATGNKEEGNI
jgi:hypothetical protein